MAYHFLVADEHEGFVSPVIKKLKMLPKSKVTHVRDALEAYRKARVQEFDGIFITDTIPKIGVRNLLAALREIEINRETPVFLLSEEPSTLSFEAARYASVFAYHRQTGIDGAITWLQDWLVNGKNIENPDEHSPVKIDLRIVNQLILAAKHSLELFAGVGEIHPLPVETFLKSSSYIDHVSVAGVTAIMSTRFAGNILIVFPEETFLRVVGGALGESYHELTPDLLDAAGELTNIIYGQAKTILVDEMQIDFMKSRPYVVTEKERIRSFHGTSSFIVPFDSNAGRFYLIVSFESIHVHADKKIKTAS